MVFTRLRWTGKYWPVPVARPAARGPRDPLAAGSGHDYKVTVAAHVQAPLVQSQAWHEQASSSQMLQTQPPAEVRAAGFAQQEPLRGCVANEAVDVAGHALGQASQVQASPEQSGQTQFTQPQSAALATVALEFA